MHRLLRFAIAAVALAALAGCATTSHYYTASDYSGVQIGSARVSSSVTVGVTPAGVTITPHVSYSLPRKKAK